MNKISKISLTFITIAADKDVHPCQVCLTQHGHWVGGHEVTCKIQIPSISKSSKHTRSLHKQTHHRPWEQMGSPRCRNTRSIVGH